MQTIWNVIDAVEDIWAKLKSASSRPEDVEECVSRCKEALQLMRHDDIPVTSETSLDGNPRLYGRVCGKVQLHVRELLEDQPELQEEAHRLLHLDLPVRHWFRIADNNWEDILDTSEICGDPDAPLTETGADRINAMLLKYAYWKIVGNALPDYCGQRYKNRMVNGGIPQEDAKRNIVAPLMQLFSQIEAMLAQAKSFWLEKKCAPSQYFNWVIAFLGKNLGNLEWSMSEFITRHLTSKLTPSVNLETFIEGDLSTKYAFRTHRPNLSESALLEVVLSRDLQRSAIIRSGKEVRIPSHLSWPSQLLPEDEELIEEYFMRHPVWEKRSERDFELLCHVINSRNHHGFQTIRPKDIKPRI